MRREVNQFFVELWQIFLDTWHNHRGKVTGAILGWCFGVLVLIIGFWNTMFLVFCLFIGAFLGTKFDSEEDFKKGIDQISIRLSNWKNN